MSTKIIAIDGFASTGKSTLSKRLAQHLGFTYMDTGYMFRVVALQVLKNKWLEVGELNDAALASFLPELNFHWVDQEDGLKSMGANGVIYGEEIRTQEVSALVSQVAANAAVRQHLLEQQRSLAKSANVVMDGRDIGTVVFPQADLKFYLIAQAEIRAQRRFDEMQAKGLTADFDAILANVLERDHLDSTREIAPLKKADDAIEIDTSHYTVEEVFALLCQQLPTDF